MEKYGVRLMSVDMIGGFHRRILKNMYIYLINSHVNIYNQGKLGYNTIKMIDERRRNYAEHKTNF